MSFILRVCISQICRGYFGNDPQTVSASAHVFSPTPSHLISDLNAQFVLFGWIYLWRYRKKRFAFFLSECFVRFSPINFVERAGKYLAMRWHLQYISEESGKKYKYDSLVERGKSLFCVVKKPSLNYVWKQSIVNQPRPSMWSFFLVFYLFFF